MERPGPSDLLVEDIDDIGHAMLAVRESIQQQNGKFDPIEFLRDNLESAHAVGAVTRKVLFGSGSETEVGPRIREERKVNLDVAYRLAAAIEELDYDYYQEGYAAFCTALQGAEPELKRFARKCIRMASMPTMGIKRESLKDFGFPGEATFSQLMTLLSP